MKILPLLIALAGCASIERPQLTSLYPDSADASGKTWRYEAKSDAAHPEDSPKAEQQRLDWLAELASENSACPQGYDVTNRQPVKKNAYRHTIYYTVRCR